MLNFIDNIKFAIKLPAAIAVIGVTIATVVAFVSFQDAKHTLLQVSEANLSANVEVKQAGLQNWLLEIQDDLLVQSQNPTVISAVQDFSDSWLQIEGDPQSRLQTLYITDNPHPTGSKENLDAAPDGSIYSAVHARYHPYFRELQRRNEYYDVFLFDTSGNLVYSVFKELDYATNLVSGKWADTDLGGAFRAARDNKASGDPSFFDFRPYGPSYDAPASFISIPLTGTEGNFVGVLAYQMPVGRLNALMGDRGGLGESGQAYIVGTDGMFRSDLPLTDSDDILVESPVKEDFGSLSSEETTLLVRTGVSGQKVVRATTLMEFMGTRWAFSAEQDFSELVAPARELRNALILQIFVGAVLIALIGWLLSRYFTKPLVALQGSIERISADDLEGAVPGTNRRDELGAIANSLDGLKTSLEKSKAMERNQEQVVITLSKSLGDLATGDLASRINRDMPEEYRGLKDSFNRTVDALASSFNAVSENAIKVRNSSTQINKSAEALSQRTESQAATLEETAAALEQLAASVSSTADGAKQADELARSTHDNAEASRIVMDKAVTSIQGIEASTGQISQVVGMINDIAFQTNLLALNAGVEAARAGDAGRGFAVVATEVRQLAQRCAESADEITQLVEKSKLDVGSGVDNVTEAVGAIQGVLGSVKEISTAVASISVATQEQSSGLGEINSAVSQLDQVTQQNAAMVEDTKAASAALSAESDQLDRQVRKFNLGSNSSSRPNSGVNASEPDTNSAHQAQAQLIQNTNLKPRVPSNDAWEEF